MDEIIHHLAVFFIKYLRTLGFEAINDIFAEYAWYFRNSLVRANYNDLKNGIHETTELLEAFLRNLLLNESRPLHNRTLHISGTFKEPRKPDIEKESIVSGIRGVKAMGEKGIFGCKKQVINSRELGIGQTKRSAEIYLRTSGIRTRCSSRISECL